VLRLDPDGRIDASFSLAAASTAPRRPESVLTTVHAGDEMLIVFDRVTRNRLRLLVYHLDGTFAEQETRRLRRLLSDTAAGLLGAAAADSDVIHIAEAGTGRILSFDLSGHFLGSARWHGEVSALALDRQGRLVVAGAGLVALEAGRPAASGTFRIGPIAAPFAPPEGASWQLVRALLDPLPADAHVQLFAWTTDQAGQAAPGLDDPGWQSAPLDATSWRPHFDPASFLWVGGRLTCGGPEGPLVRGLRVEFDREGWLRHLPAIYARESSDFLEPALAALEDALREQEDEIDGLPRLFDPAAAPAADLDWLAGWLAYELEESFDEQTRRQAIARAFELQGMRGTADSLLGAIELVLGIQAQISEPAAHLKLWRLGDSAGLGFDTGLFAGEPDGAIVGATAELDGSSLERDEDFGGPLFDATAHRFCVRVYASDLAGQGARAALERLVDRERPAETEAHVCVIEPSMRVGFQATIGLDSVVGREEGPMRLGEEGLLGAGASLRDEPARITLSDSTHLRRGMTLI
jgi:phage tail-like protein